MGTSAIGVKFLIIIVMKIWYSWLMCAFCSTTLPILRYPISPACHFVPIHTTTKFFSILIELYPKLVCLSKDDWKRQIHNRQNWNLILLRTATAKMKFMKIISLKRNFLVWHVTCYLVYVFGVVRCARRVYFYTNRIICDHLISVDELHTKLPT